MKILKEIEKSRFSVDNLNNIKGGENPGGNACAGFYKFCNPHEITQCAVKSYCTDYTYCTDTNEKTCASHEYTCEYVRP